MWTETMEDLEDACVPLASLPTGASSSDVTWRLPCIPSKQHFLPLYLLRWTLISLLLGFSFNLLLFILMHTSHNGQIRINSLANRFDRVVTLLCSAASPPKLLPGLATRLRALATRQTLFTASFSSRFGEAETAFAESLD